MESKVVLVTGACGALGRAVVASLARRGARPAAVDLASGPAPEGATFSTLGVDIADPATARRTVERIVSEAGRLDGLVNVAGGFIWRKVADQDDGGWDRLHRMNVSTTLEMSRAALPHLIAARGAIVNVGALAAAGRAAAGMGGYAAAKAAVAKLTESLADEMKDAGVRVNAVLPSILDTAANRRDMPDADAARWVSPASMAAVIAFLLSNDAEAVTGALVPVSGRL